MKKNKVLFLIAFTLIASFSCSDDVAEFDVRIQAEGEYRYWRIKNVLIPTSGQPTPLGTAYDFNGVYRISKDPNNNSGLLVMEDGQEVFKLSDVTETYNGFTFKVPSQLFKEDGQSYTITGYEGVPITSATGVTLFQGVSHSSGSALEFWFQYTQNGSTMVYKVTNIKK